MKRKIIYLFIAALAVTPQLLHAQNVGINNDNSIPATSAMLDVKSTDKGILIPRMTTAQRTAITSPANGLMVYDLTTNSFWFYKNTAWTEVTGSITLPYNGTHNANVNSFTVTNLNTGTYAYAIAGNSNGSGTAIAGSAGGTGDGVNGASIYGAGVSGFSTAGAGGNFNTDGNAAGVMGFSSEGRGGSFESDSDSAGVYGISTSGPGGEFKSTTGPAIKSSGNVDVIKGRLHFTGDPSTSFTQGIEFTNGAGTALNGFLGKYNDSIIGFYGYTGGGWKTLFNNTNGNVGLQGNTNPRAPLAFASTIGNKIALWGNADVAHYGIGMGGGALQFYTDGTNSDIVMGYGSSATFTENMRIKGNGNVGIGTSTPTEKLQVNGNAKIAGNTSIIGAIQVANDATFASNISILGGNPAAGKVLTSIGSNGNAEWRMPAIKNSGIAAGLSETTTSIPFVPTDTNGTQLSSLRYVTVPFSAIGGFDDAGVFSNSAHAVTVGSGVYYCDATVRFDLSQITNQTQNNSYQYRFQLELIETAPDGTSNFLLSDNSTTKSKGLYDPTSNELGQIEFKISGIHSVAAQGIVRGRFYFRLHIYTSTLSNSGYYIPSPTPAIIWDYRATHLSFFKLY